LLVLEVDNEGIEFKWCIRERNFPCWRNLKFLVLIVVILEGKSILFGCVFRVHKEIIVLWFIKFSICSDQSSIF